MYLGLLFYSAIKYMKVLTEYFVAKLIRSVFMKNKALVVIDLQNDITKNYKRIIERVNSAVDWAYENNMRTIQIKDVRY